MLEFFEKANDNHLFDYNFSLLSFVCKQNLWFYCKPLWRNSGQAG
ncbi:hypothetical protein HMPREF1051_2232 [Neisseria sicca VK64]|uniref:Uncharacterized protein n=1 Tax=Neisseria sicca VK64 TaxID=1095748 RepID=I2NR15_NEISI|nr:hypothetical protein HMPREF1051_2232 [Neisseria sicca VK64]